MADVYPNVYESLKFPAHKHVILEDPLSSSRTLSSMKNLDDVYTIGDQFLNDKSTEDELGTLNVEAKVVSMVTVPIHQASSSIPPLSTPIIDLSPPKLVPFTTQAPIFTATTTTTTTTLLLPPHPQQIQKHVALYEALKASMERAKKDEFLAEKDKSPKRRRDDQDPPSPPPKDSDQSKQKRHDSDASGSKQPLAPQSSTWKTSNTREAPFSSSKKKKLTKADLEGPAFKVIRPFHNNNISLQFQMEECHLLLTDQVDLVNPEGHRVVPDVSKPLGDKGRRSTLSISKLKAAQYLDFGLKELVSSLWIESEREYDISATYGISYWWFKRKEFYITRNNASSNHSAVRSHMWNLSVVSLKTYERYRYTILKEIVLCRANYKESKISEANFKNLHPNDFEDLNLLHLQGQLNHLSGVDKFHPFNAVNLWIRSIIIRKCVEDLQFEIESYQTKLNLTQPDCNASDFLFKEDYTIVSKPKALDHMVKDFKLFKYNSSMETRKWSEDDRRRSKDFLEVIERRLKIRRIFRSLKSFVGGRLSDVDYRLIQRTE
ncbi:hypothetical protein Tco_1290450 [Tanacetum coccineum]